MSQVLIRKNRSVVLKMDEEKRIVKGPVYVPLVKDTQGDFMTGEEIQKMAYQFMSDLNLRNVDVKHNFQKVDAYVCESYIVAKEEEDWPVGSWVIAMKVDDDDLWNDVLNGEYEAFSMAGLATRVNDVEIPA